VRLTSARSATNNRNESYKRRFRRRGEWLLGYRYLNVEVEDRRNEMELSLHGPMVGFGFVF
jgi:hypothetical protein